MFLCNDPVARSITKKELKHKKEYKQEAFRVLAFCTSDAVTEDRYIVFIIVYNLIIPRSRGCGLTG